MVLVTHDLKEIGIFISIFKTSNKTVIKKVRTPIKNGTVKNRQYTKLTQK